MFIHNLYLFMKPHRQIPLHTPEEKLDSPYDITTCRAGTSGCKNALVDVKGIAENIRLNLDTAGLGEFIKTKANGNVPYHAVRITEAMPVIDYILCVLCGDCAKVCPTEAIIIEKRGLKVMASGKLGRHPRLAETIDELAPENKIYRFIKQIIAVNLSKRT
ncbi:MAG: 4Fe-4S binding protein [Deltaproteobacteria bacterium]|nr:4Fe-4S binding protein [Deltaproteobacteria bacterium]